MIAGRTYCNMKLDHLKHLKKEHDTSHINITITLGKFHITLYNLEKDYMYHYQFKGWRPFCRLGKHLSCWIRVKAVLFVG